MGTIDRAPWFGLVPWQKCYVFSMECHVAKRKDRVQLHITPRGSAGADVVVRVPASQTQIAAQVLLELFELFLQFVESGLAIPRTPLFSSA